MVEVCMTDADDAGPNHLVRREADRPTQRPVIPGVQKYDLVSVNELEARASEPPHRKHIAVSGRWSSHCGRSQTPACLVGRVLGVRRRYVGPRSQYRGTRRGCTS